MHCGIAQCNVVEFAALREANADYQALAVRILDGDATVSEADGLVAKEAVRAQTAARAVFRRECEAQAEPN